MFNQSSAPVIDFNHQITKLSSALRHHWESSLLEVWPYNRWFPPGGIWSTECLELPHLMCMEDLKQ